MLFQKELKKTAVLAVIGGIIGLIMLISGNYPYWYSFIMPFWAIGTFFGGMTLFKMAISITKMYLLSQFISFFLKNIALWTTLFIVLWVFGLAAILYFGWIIGIGMWCSTLYISYLNNNKYPSKKKINNRQHKFSQHKRPSSKSRRSTYQKNHSHHYRN